MTEDRTSRIRAALERELAPTQLDIYDDSAKHAGHAGAREGGHFRVRLVSEAFRGKNAIERHRLVFAAVGDLMGRGIHALNIEAKTPEEIGS
ncbi:MAG TPA: BolA family protein [Steroidobacteraceae bacterium]|nr:BolA family protein [Steroidobacteraceae bacterium]